MAQQQKQVRVAKSIYERDGKYLLRYRDRTGRQRGKTFSTLEEAESARERIKRTPPQARPKIYDRRFNEFAQEWFENKKLEIEEGTASIYSYGVAAACDFFGATKIGAVTRDDIIDFVKEIETTPCQGQRGRSADKRRSYGTVRLYLTPLRLIMNEAVNRGLEVNPAVGVNPTRQRRRRDAEDRDRVLTPQQVDALSVVAPPQHRVLFILLPRTGLRISEALGLQLRDWNPKTQTLQIRRQYHKGKYKPYLKSANGRRDIRVHSTTAGVLNTHIRELAAEFKNQVNDLPSLPLFPSYQQHKGIRPYTQAGVATQFKKAVTEVGAPWASPHSCRHYCASALIMSNEAPLTVVARYIGDTLPVLVRTYAHVIDQELVEVPDILGVSAAALKSVNT